MFILRAISRRPILAAYAVLICSQRLVRPSKSSVFSSEEDAIYPPNATGFNLQMAKHKAVANVTHAR